MLNVVINVCAMPVLPPRNLTNFSGSITRYSSRRSLAYKNSYANKSTGQTACLYYRRSRHRAAVYWTGKSADEVVTQLQLANQQQDLLTVYIENLIPKIHSRKTRGSDQEYVVRGDHECANDTLDQHISESHLWSGLSKYYLL